MPVQAQGEFAPLKEKLVPALELSGQPVKRGTMAHKHIVYMMLVDTAAGEGDEAAIREYAPLLEELAVRDEHRPYLAVAHRAWGVAHRLAGEYDEADVRLQKALELFTEFEFPWQMGRTLVELGELALARDEADTARDHFTGAQTAFENVGAKPDADRISKMLASIA